MEIQSVPLASILESQPELVKSVIQRNKLSLAKAKKLHVLVFGGAVSDVLRSAGRARATTTVVLTSKPCLINAVAWNTAVKSPMDDFSDVGFRVALSRAVKSLNG